jgi:hypothetical protein
MDSITTNGALGDGNPSMFSIPFTPNQQLLVNQSNQQQNLTEYNMTSSSHLLEVRRDVERMMGTVPGAMPPGMNWLNNVLTGGWVGASDGPMEEQLMTNVGMSYDFISTLNQPTFNIHNIGTSGGGIHINAMQGAGAPRAGMINIGH